MRPGSNSHIVVGASLSSGVRHFARDELYNSSESGRTAAGHVFRLAWFALFFITFRFIYRLLPERKIANAA